MVKILTLKNTKLTFKKKKGLIKVKRNYTYIKHIPLSYIQ